MFLGVGFSLLALQHDGVISRELVGVVQHIRLKVAAMERWVSEVRCDRADHGVVQAQLIQQHGAHDAMLQFP
jgi:hypothetical protein